MKKLVLLIALFVTSIFNVWAQKYELGKVTLEELNEKKHPIDSSAAAAILFKKGDVKFQFSEQNGFEMVTNVKMKIKIYKKEGYDWANFSQRFYINGSTRESVYFKNAVTYNVIDGKIEKTKLKSDGEFLEKVNKFWDRKKITMPNVKEGSIIEFEYTLNSPHLSVIDKWDFQTSIPINYCEYRTFIPEYFQFNANQKGFVFPTVQTEQNTRSLVFNSKERTDEGRITKTEFSSEKVDYIENRTTFTIKDVPALKDESFVNNINNYTSSITYELSAVKYPNQPYKSFSTDWESVTKTIYENESFGNELTKTGYFENDIDALLKDVSSQQERMALIFNFVKSKVKWNEYYGFYCDEGVRKAYKDKIGNVAEINLMLVAMLRHANIEANPILLSTRANGIPIFPNRTAFNYVIAGVELENTVVLLDATDPFALPNVIPVHALNWNGRIIRKNGSSAEINLMPTAVSSDVINLMATVSEEGTVEGKIREQHFDYNAFVFRSKYANSAKENYLEFLEGKRGKIEINDYDVTGKKELDQPIVENYSFKSTNSVETIGDKIYFSPLLFLAIKENPFKQEKREYPVDFTFPSEDKYIINLTIPEGYAVESLPKSKSIAMSDNLVGLKYLVAATDNRIQVSLKFDINSSIISPEYYDELKAVFNEIVKLENEKVVLKKI